MRRVLPFLLFVVSAPIVEVVALKTESFIMGSISDYEDNVILNAQDEVLIIDFQ